MEQIHIRSATPADLAQLQRIGRQTFFETFAAGNTEANMKNYLEENFASQKLAAELADRNSAFYFAVLKGEVVGYLKLNFGASQTELKEDKGVEIERIYVLQQFQGKGVGQLLFEKAVQTATERKADYIWLGVWEKNLSAINFYSKNGFVAFGSHVFKLGEDEQTDMMMKRQLTDK